MDTPDRSAKASKASTETRRARKPKGKEPMVTFCFKVRRDDLDLFTQLAEEVGLSAASLARECLRTTLASGGMLDPDTAKHILAHRRIRMNAGQNRL